MAVRDGKTYKTVADLKGLELGTVEGYVWVKSIQAVPDAKLHAYPDANGVFDDLGAGRVDVGFLDPLIIIAAQKERPDLKIDTQYLTPPTAAEVKAEPDYQYFQPYQTGFDLPKKATKLEAAISAQIDAMYTNGELANSSRSTAAIPSSSSSPPPTSPPHAGEWTGPRTGPRRPSPSEGLTCPTSSVFSKSSGPTTNPTSSTPSGAPSPTPS